MTIPISFRLTEQKYLLRRQDRFLLDVIARARLNSGTQRLGAGRHAVANL